MAEVGQKERTTQEKVIHFLSNSLGYQSYGNWGKRETNSNVEEEVLRSWLSRQGYSEKLISKALREVDKKSSITGAQNLYEANRAFYTLLRYGVKIKPEVGEQTVTVWLIDWENPENNDFGVAEEVTIQEKQTKRPDIVLYVNGIAIGVLELKRSTVSLSEGIRQNLNNQAEGAIPSFFSTIQLVMAGNETQGLRYGVVNTPEQYWLQWKEEGEDSTDIEEPLLAELGYICGKRRLLELIHDFQVFDSGIKKICRYNQYFGVKAAQESAKKGQSGIIWHTQGSGKSITMVWLAKWIREHIDDARVLLVTDRKELDDQIKGVFEGVDEKIYQTQSGSDLVSTVANSEKWLVCSLIHKFHAGESSDQKETQRYIQQLKEAADKGLKAKGNFFVFVDECHRSQSGDLNEAMKALIPNATFIGFTGTPLLKKDKQKSVEVFGPYIHTYKFDQGVGDEVILDLQYEARDIDQELTSQDKIDRWFHSKTKGLSDIGKAELKRRWGTLKKLLSSHDRLRKIVSDILMDMQERDRLKTGRGNAMLVTQSIHAACRVYSLFQDTEIAGKCAIVTSYDPSQDEQKDEVSSEGETENREKYQIYRKMVADHFREDEESAIKKLDKFEENVKQRFVKEPGQMKLLIVVDKLLTGFDAPPATYLYIDKKMQDHGLFQAICRVNRLDTEDKEYGYIIDYQDLFKSLKKSIEDYTGEAFDGYDDKDVKGLLKDRLKKSKERLEEVREQIKALCEGVEPPYDSKAYQDFFIGPSDQPDLQKQNEQKRVQLYKLTAAYLRAYANLANEMTEAGYSEEEARTIKAEVDHYEKVRQEVKLASGDYVDTKVFDPAMRQLLDMYIRAEESETLSSLDDMSLVDLIVEKGQEGTKELPGSLQKNPEAMAETIESNVRKVIIDESDVNPQYYEQMSQLLNDLIEQRRQEAIDYQQYMEKIVELTRKVKNPEQHSSYPEEINTKALQAFYDNLERKKSGVAADPPEPYADQDEEDFRVKKALQVDQAIRNSKMALWKGQWLKEKKVKNAIKQVVKDDEALAQKLLDIAREQDEY
jgi:type I restriction enzyme R subunit